MTCEHRLLDPALHYRDGALWMEDVALKDIAQQVGTPAYVYSTAALARQYRLLADSLADAMPKQKTLICYALKANSNQAVLTTIGQLGAGADVVSLGELRRALAAGIPADKIVFAGVGKTPAEMQAGLEAGILQFNVESLPELEALNAQAAAMGKRASIALRINPDVDAKTHAKITTGTAENKFGVTIPQAERIAAELHNFPAVQLEALSMHIGSQILALDAYDAAFARIAELAKRLIAGGHALKRLDVGGGLGIAYRPDQRGQAGRVADYVAMIKRHLSGFGLSLVLEPGRYLVGNAGVLLSQVVYVKPGDSKQFLILDAAMNDLIRPAMYEAHHEIVPLEDASDAAQQAYDVVGPVCETGDTFAKNMPLPRLQAGQLVAFQSAGAYAAVMASSYNSRGLVPEVLVKGGKWQVIRARQSLDDLIALDQVPNWL